jgi:uracil-DNA glycosylase family 4
VIVVPGSGPENSGLMAIGEAPGAVESQLLRPLVGPSGAAFNWYLNRHGFAIGQFYLDNVVREYRQGNPDPTPEQIAEWTPVLEATIARVKPRVIITLGRFAARWFLGEDADMDSCHGIPHEGGEFAAPHEQVMYRARAQGAVIVPSFHPAFGLRQVDARTLIDHDIEKAADVIRLVRGGRRDLVRFRRDAYAGREQYTDVTGAELHENLRRYRRMGLTRIGFDTEGTPEEPFSLQVSPEPGVAWMLRPTQSDFAIGVEALQELADAGVVFVVHDAGTPRGTGYDTQVSRTCGLRLSHAKFHNTMYSAFALRIEPKGLKPLLWRWCGMRQHDYWGMVEEIGRQKQIGYLKRVAWRGDMDAIQRLSLALARQAATDLGLATSMSNPVAQLIESLRPWPRVPSRVERQNDGTLALVNFGKLESRAKGILTDIMAGELGKDGKPTDPLKRWKQIEPELRVLAERELGKIPMGTMFDVPFDQAVFYGCRDADGEIRLDPELGAECRRMGVDGVCWTGNEVLPIFEEMQHDGMPASRRAFIDLAETCQHEMDQLQSQISVEHWGGKPFNPAPNTKDVEALVVRLGITGLKTTAKSKKPSTSMKSLEYLGNRYPAISLIGEWRRRYKVLSTYCLPLIEVADEQLGIETRQLAESDMFLVRGNIKPATVETRRLAMEEPSLLNVPVRTEIGRRVRGCYMTTNAAHDDDPDNPDTEVFLELDYSSQEVRITAHVTGDRLLCDICRDPKRKIHMETASRVFGKPIDQIDEISEKIPAKTAFFGMLYGMQGPGLLDLFRSFGLENWPIEECERLIAEIFKIYPGLKETIWRIEQETKRTGMVRDLYGHIRYLPGIWSARRGEANEAARQAFSHAIQATAQGQIQNAMAQLRKPIREMQLGGLFVRWALQVHDSVLVRTRRWLVPIVARLIEEAMTQKYGGPRGLKLSVPVLVEWHASTQWSKLK